MRSIFLLVLILFIGTPIHEVVHNSYLRQEIAPNVLEFSQMSVNMFTRESAETIYGTGFQINYGGEQFIVTNKHVCNFGNKGGMIKVAGIYRKILSISIFHDLCLIEPLFYRKGLDLAGAMYRDEPLWVIGHPRGLPQTIRKGKFIVTSSEKFPWIGDHYVSYHLLDIVAYGGSSGSPIVDTLGNVVGVLFGAYRGYHTEAFIVPLEDLMLFLATRI